MTATYTLAEFGNHIDAFLERMRQRNLSAMSITAYQRDLQQLLDILAENHSAQERLTAQHLRQVLMRLSQRGLSARSLARKISVWKQYIIHLRQFEHWQTDIGDGLNAPKAPKRLPKAIAAEPLNQWFAHGEQHDDAMGIRDQAMFEVLYGCGLRLSELRDLNVQDVQLEAGWVTVIGKGHHQRQVPLGLKARLAIEAYLPIRQAAADETALFTSRLGKRIGTRQIQIRLDIWAQKQQADRYLSPHMLRHSYASHVLQNSHNIRAVQELLGHKQLSTTQIYTSLDFSHLSEVYDATHPRAKKHKSK
ncbi:tyrosine-type recombinase/integrase [Vitreoscilla stercoraria]|uniref:Tyrosine recombinase XerC n=1 Tax=Vitreoscilla stercoraria TaxID=61 RepID=A0ABY4E9Z1_VITST|nr:tyrosine-type recombinase/integrase [Vitreoscilla stercoraria]UOO92128.1 tyrosine-type recombinase/integrase [Vitreoscilla stercoraria]